MYGARSGNIDSIHIAFIMKLSIGIVGLPNVGKSTLFNALTKKSVPAENYPFCTIDPSVGIVPVPDERLEILNSLLQSEKTIPAVVEFVDIAGLVKGASEGEGLGNKFLSNIKEVDAIAEVVRIFEDSNITHVSGNVDPISDIETINLELVLSDMQTVAKRMDSVAKDVKRADKEAVALNALLIKLNEILEAGKFASELLLHEEEKELARPLNLLTSKKVLYVLNKKAGGQNLDEMNDGRFEVLIEYLKKLGAEYVIVDAKIEDDLKEIDSAEKEQFRRELGSFDDGLNNLIKQSYKTLDLITFFTTGPDETRAWTIKQGSFAPEAGTAIHTDFRDKFIRAEVVFWRDLVDGDGYAKAREKGLVRTEGKEYVVQDGDVIEFKI